MDVLLCKVIRSLMGIEVRKRQEGKVIGKESEREEKQ